MNRKDGFTLTEVIIVLVILGALALILVPNLSNIIPDDHNIKYKKAFYTIQEIINDIVNDPQYCSGYDDEGNDISATPLAYCLDPSQPDFPAYLDDVICERLSTTQVGECGGKGIVDHNNDDVRTTNGMRWRLPETSLDSNFGTAIIYVDVDGGNNDLNAERNSKNGVYRIVVNSDGRVTAPNDNDGDDGKSEQSLLLDSPTE